MLTAAVLGAVFTSPSVLQIFKAITAVTSRRRVDEEGKGCLLIVKNYTGDILNFRLAREMAIQDGYNVEMIIVGDDVTHQRGVAGTVFIHKLCGAMAERGDSLSEIFEFMKSKLKITSEQVLNNGNESFIRSIGIGLNSISMPGNSEPLYELSDSDPVYELGLGIHGEKGVCRLTFSPTNPVTEISNTMIEHLLPKEFSAENLKFALMINNLGSTTLLEMYNIARVVITLLENQNISIERVYVGTFMTALNMHGFSLSLLNLAQNSEQLLELLDTPTESMFWPTSLNLSKKSNNSSRTSHSTGGIKLSPQIGITATTKSIISTEENSQVEKFLSLTGVVCDFILTRIKEYNSLDSEVGDGDCGSAIERACESIQQHILKKQDLKMTLAELVYQIGICVQNSGGSSGAIISMFFLRYSKSLKTNSFDHKKAFIEGVHGMMELGDSKKGDRTMLDTLIPVSEYLQEQEESIDVETIVKVANEGMDSTKSMLAKRGRSRYLGDRVLGFLDPGALCMFDIVKIWSLWMLDKSRVANSSDFFREVSDPRVFFATVNITSCTI
ncbi:predicted protein [Naegleria gruberi]|uniref:Predicted protein n=1 Tax=Naegleria gruberi TaxID=5762 RepID=D2VUG3_NAEGR|nr:uncharacterized protein NAEGRDRAFT_72653 [Naegleria gruberi]EFC39442.1 predicted protein [Naegleria gruberi]|eukprot:XP_002672186.1 predicted protein [Naegleria gruberi strain NEG-M]